MQPAPHGSGAPPGARRPSKPGSEGVAWESLIEFKETEEPIVAAKPDPKPRHVSEPATAEVLEGRPPSRSWPLIIAAGAFGLVMLGVIIIIITKNGRVTIDTEKGNSTITIDQRAGGLGGAAATHGAAEDSRASKPPAQSTTPESEQRAVATTGPLPPGPNTDSASGTGGSPTSEGSDLRQPSVPPAAVKPDSRSNPGSISNSIGMKLALILAGEFTMGALDRDTAAFNDEKPQHHVRITRPFYLGVYEVTQGQYQAVAGENPSNFKGADNLPVEQVSWLAAVEFCNQLSEREGRRPYYGIAGGAVTITGGNGYRLPTEAEWEYACRAGSPTDFGVGDGSREDWAWFNMNSAGKTHPVGEKQPNAFGLFDMYGNVLEWCSDYFDQGYYRQSRPDDPTGPARASYRVIRGGCWDYPARFTRSTYRSRRAAGLPGQLRGLPRCPQLVQRDQGSVGERKA